jgi:hypothetical protein
MQPNYPDGVAEPKDDWSDRQRRFQVLYDRTYRTFERQLPNSHVAKKFVLFLDEAGIDPHCIVDKVVAYSCGGDCCGPIRRGFESEIRAIERTLRRMRSEVLSLRSIKSDLLGEALVAKAFAEDIEKLADSLERSWNEHCAQWQTLKSARTYFRMELFLVTATELLRIKIGRPCYKELTAFLACADPHNKRWNDPTGLDVRRACERYVSTDFSKQLVDASVAELLQHMCATQQSRNLLEIASQGRKSQHFKRC